MIIPELFFIYSSFHNVNQATGTSPVSSPPEAEEIFKKSNKMEVFPYFFLLFGKAH